MGLFQQPAQISESKVILLGIDTVHYPSDGVQYSNIRKGRDMNGANPQSAQQEAIGSQTVKAMRLRVQVRVWRHRRSAPHPRPQDVQIDILYCGVCHSDLHQARNEWQSAMPTVYPCVPGHEIVGRVVKPAAR